MKPKTMATEGERTFSVRKHAAIMFLDMVGYTFPKPRRLKGRDNEFRRRRCVDPGSSALGEKN